MNIFDKIKSFFSKPKIEKEEKKEKIYIENNIPQNIGHDDLESELNIEDIWNYIDPAKNTQSHHIISVTNFDEWIDMDDIRRRIKELFFIEYKNEKSLYPYIKTLTDVGLLENSSVGGKRKWKKRELFIRIEKKISENLKVKSNLKNISR